MKLSHSISLLMLASVLFHFSCQNSGLQSPASGSNITLHLGFEKNAHPETVKYFQQIDEVTLIVTAPDMDRIEKECTLDGDVARATVTIDKGDARKFVVIGKQQGVTLFRGVKFQDINDDNEEVRIDIPGVGFSASPREGSAPLEVTFTDRSQATGGIPLQSWYWLFGDGEESYDRNPVHTYRQPGQYRVGLGVANRDSSYNILILPDYINVLEGRTEVELAYDDNSYENYWSGEEQGEIALVHFTAPAYPARIVEAKYALMGAGDFTVAVYDYWSGDKLGEMAATVDNAEWQWVSYDISGLNIEVQDDFYVGLAWTGQQSSDMNWYPMIAYDETQPQGRSYDYFPSNNTRYSMADLGYPGNWFIRAVVEVAGTQKVIAPEGIITGTSEDINTIANRLHGKDFIETGIPEFRGHTLPDNDNHEIPERLP